MEHRLEELRAHIKQVCEDLRAMKCYKEIDKLTVVLLSLDLLILEGVAQGVITLHVVV